MLFLKGEIKMKKLEKTGYPSVDRNHEDCFGPGFLEMQMPQKTLYDYIYEENKHRLKLPAINYFDHKISYQEFLNIIHLLFFHSK